MGTCMCARTHAHTHTHTQRTMASPNTETTYWHLCNWRTGYM